MADVNKSFLYKSLLDTINEILETDVYDVKKFEYLLSKLYVLVNQLNDDTISTILMTLPTNNTPIAYRRIQMKLASIIPYVSSKFIKSVEEE